MSRQYAGSFSVSFLFYQVIHCIQAGLLVFQEEGGADRTFRKQCAAVRFVLQGNGLVRSPDQDFVFAYDVSHADGGNTDFIGLALAAVPAPPAYDK